MLVSTFKNFWHVLLCKFLFQINDNTALWEPVLMRKPQNSVIDSDSLKSKFLLLTICFLMKYGQNEVVKIWPFHPKKAVIKNWSNWKIKTIFLTSSSSWFQICKKIWKKFIFWRIFAKKTYKGSRNLSKFLFKKVALMCMLLHLSFKKIVRFV